jgi:NADPH:quinone reductase-like Zn-dependent oxidoreductase
MKAYQLRAGDGITGLKRVDVPTPQASPSGVVVRTRAASLNYRDLMFAQGNYIDIPQTPLIPVGAGAGEVVAVGDRVTRFTPGDRVVNTYFPNWIEGAPTPRKTAISLGTHADGVLADAFMVDETALVPIPAHLDYIEAATLSCAGITAWNAMFVDGGLKPGATVLLLGTGGVSIWALQLARAAGLRTIITSSSDRKLRQIEALGAEASINYRTTPEWQDEVLRLTGGDGVDLVLEIGGHDTLARSLAATRMGGSVAVIGGMSGFDGPDLQLLSLIGGVKRLSGIFVGSRVMLDDLARFVEAHEIRPVIDKVFGFDDAPAAYAHLQAGGHVGKIVVRVDD